MKNVILEQDLSYYTNYWQNNLESIEFISTELKKLLLDLETKRLTDAEINDSIESKINLLTTIYSNYNSIKGREYLQKIKALYSKYVQFSRKQSICLNTINYMFQKIDEVRDSSFSNFPGMKHEDALFGPDDLKKYEYSDEKKYKNRWICFSRNGSNFILKYNSVKLIPVTEHNISHSNGISYVYYNRNLQRVTDFFRESIFCKNEIPKIVIHKDSSIFYAADTVDKKFLANNDVLSGNTKKYNFSNSVAEGYVKLAGQRYIILK